MNRGKHRRMQAADVGSTGGIILVEKVPRNMQPTVGKTRGRRVNPRSKRASLSPWDQKGHGLETGGAHIPPPPTRSKLRRRLVSAIRRARKAWGWESAARCGSEYASQVEQMCACLVCLVFACARMVETGETG